MDEFGWSSNTRSSADSGVVGHLLEDKGDEREELKNPGPILKDRRGAVELPACAGASG